MLFTDIWKLITDTWKIMTKIKNWDINNLCGWAVSQNVPFGGFKWVENISKSCMILSTELRKNVERLFWERFVQVDE